MAAPGVDWQWFRDAEMRDNEGKFKERVAVNQKSIAELILVEVAHLHNLTVDEIVSITREREVVLPRQKAMVLMDKYTTLTLAKIGNEFSGKDHATVLHAKKTIANICETDKSFKAEFDDLDAIIRYKLKEAKLDKYTKMRVV
jgi:chromosomal replication initiator protein